MAETASVASMATVVFCRNNMTIAAIETIGAIETVKMTAMV